MILEATGELDVELVMTTGSDPADLGLTPLFREDVYIRDYIPLSEVFPSCDLVISHGGFGTLQAALRHGLPQVLLPIAADQPDNARHCEAHGVAVVLEEGARSVAELRAAIEEVLGYPNSRRRARRWQAAIDSLPGPSDVVALLERADAGE